MGDDNIATLAREIASALAALPGVLAVARSGSGATAIADTSFGLDLSVFVSAAPPIVVSAVHRRARYSACRLVNCSGR